HRRLARVRGVFGPVMNIVRGAGVLVGLWYGGREAIAGRLSIGDLVAFIGYLGQLAWPTMALGWMLSIVQRGRAAMQRLNELFAVAPAITSPAGVTAPADVRGELVLRGVSFRYPGRPDAPPVLDDVDLTIPAGSTVALVGRTGAGKSTLVQLLPRLFDVDAGAILLDGRDVRTLPLRACSSSTTRSRASTRRPNARSSTASATSFAPGRRSSCRTGSPRSRRRTSSSSSRRAGSSNPATTIRSWRAVAPTPTSSGSN